MKEKGWGIGRCDEMEDNAIETERLLEQDEGDADELEEEYEEDESEDVDEDNE